MNYIDDINNFYFNLIKKHGNSNESVGYSIEGQITRYQIIDRVTNYKGKSVLEIGPGVGSYYDFLIKKDQNIDYTGYEINPQFISILQENKKGINIHKRNIIEEGHLSKHDIVVFFGGLNSKINDGKDNLLLTKKMIKSMYEACNDFCAISMTSTFVDSDYNQDYMFYYNPSEILDYAQKHVTRNATIYHDYLPHDFSLILYK